MLLEMYDPQGKGVLINVHTSRLDVGAGDDPTLGV